jgi:hypothetical protein
VSSAQTSINVQTDIIIIIDTQATTVSPAPLTSLREGLQVTVVEAQPTIADSPKADVAGSNPSGAHSREHTAGGTHCPGVARRVFEHRRALREKVKWRTGSEGRLNHIKRSDGWNRTELSGINGARTWCGRGVFAHSSSRSAPCNMKPASVFQAEVARCERSPTASHLDAVAFH